MQPDAKIWIDRLGLSPHPEGGYYRETYRCAETAPASALPRRFGGERPFSTAIYFLLEGSRTSKFHRLKSDEIWHHYDGAAVLLHIIDVSGHHREILLGKNADRGECPQSVISSGAWLAAELADRAAYALVGCTVAPGFDFKDFELADRANLLAIYPSHRTLIERLT